MGWIDEIKKNITKRDELTNVYHRALTEAMGELQAAGISAEFSPEFRVVVPQWEVTVDNLCKTVNVNQLETIRTQGNWVTQGEEKSYKDALTSWMSNAFKWVNS